MSMLEKRRQRPIFGDVFAWLEDELPVFPMLRANGPVRVMRLEDYVENGEYVLRAELPGVDPEKDGKITAFIHQGTEVTSRPDPYSVSGVEDSARLYGFA